MKCKREILSALSLFCWLVVSGAFGGGAELLKVESVTPLNDRDYGPVILNLLREAHDNIKAMHFQVRFYDEYPDSMSNHFLEELVKAKQRGVDVCVLLDRSPWNEDNMEFNHDFARRLLKEGIEVYLDSTEVVSHWKVLLVDDVATVVGSTNWSYFALEKNNEASVLLWGKEPNESFTRYFHEMLAQAEKFSPAEAPPVKKLEESLGVLPAQGVKQLTDRGYFPELQQLFQEAEKRIYVAQMSAFYYNTPPEYGAEQWQGETHSPTNVLLAELVAAKKRGVDVRVLLDVQENRENNNIDFAVRLTAENVPVYFDSPTTTTHCKLVLVDDDKVVVGSTNWSYNALVLGNEASVLIVSPEVAQLYEKYFMQLVKSAAPFGSSSGKDEPAPVPASPQNASRGESLAEKVEN